MTLVSKRSLPYLRINHLRTTKIPSPTPRQPHLGNEYKKRLLNNQIVLDQMLKGFTSASDL